MKNTRRRIFVLLLGIPVAAFLLYVIPFGPDPGEPVGNVKTSVVSARLTEEKADEGSINDLDLCVTEVAGVEKQKILSMLKDKYEAVIYHPRIQLQAVEALVRMLKTLYPNSWQAHVKDYLAAAFPDYADELIDTYLKLSVYSRWADENREALAGLPLYRIRELIRGKREEIFGDDASIIWEMELKKDEVKTVISDIEEQTDLSFQEKADYYKAQLSEIYGEMSQAYIGVHRQDLINTFLGAESVQEDLQAMAEKERHEQLRELRKTMGLAEDALNRWADLDEKRDSRWAQGAAYIKAREQLLKTAGGEDLEDKLDELRCTYFGDSLAETIRREEASGLYRFERKRLYGKN